MKKILSIVMAAIALAAVNLGAQSAFPSTASPTYSAISLPFTTISGGNTNLGGLTNNTSTNLASGWSAITITTNIVTKWTNNPGAFVNYTNMTTNTVTTYADFSAFSQGYTVLEWAISASGSSVSNAVLTIARGVTGTNFDTANNLRVTNTATAGTKASIVYQIDMRGFPYGRVVTFDWISTNATQVLTNQGLFFSSNLKQL